MKIKHLPASQKCRTIGAFSLVEVTIAMALIVIAGVALMSGYTSGVFTMRMTRDNLRATQIMLEMVETLRLCSWTEINTTNFVPSTFTRQYDPNATNGAYGVTYTGTIEITNAPVNASYSNDIKQITVNLSWKTGNLSRNRSMTTWVAANGIQDYIY